MVTMHGFFDLHEGNDESEFKKTYQAFGDYLIENNLITGHKVMRRSYHAGYDSGAPETRFYVSMDFIDLEQANACWDYIEERQMNSHVLHRNVYAQIRNASFFLSEDIPAK
ncbi:MAG: DUF6614 family protein [Chloroflexota bacterium]